MIYEVFRGIVMSLRPLVFSTFLNHRDIPPSADQISCGMAAFTTAHDADQEVSALSFILSALESSGVISFDSPVERNRARKAKPLQKVAKCLVRKTLDNVAVGTLVGGDKYCAISLDDDVFQPCGSINPERENKTKTYV
jgi:hypothetical protein